MKRLFRSIDAFVWADESGGLISWVFIALAALYFGHAVLASMTVTQ